MTTVLLASATAALFGCADFLGGVASRRVSALAVTATSHALSLALLVFVLLFTLPVAVARADLTWGALAGICGGFGVAALYAALAMGRMSVIAPVTAALSGALPATYDLVRGSTVRPTGMVGIVLALVAVVIVSVASDPAEDERATSPASIGWALLAGVGFAGAFVAFSMTGTESGVWPLVSARVASVSLMVVIALARRTGPIVGRSALAPTLAAGVLDTSANITMLAAIRIGPLAIASVLGSLYPVATVLLARVFLGERVRGLQGAGIALALVAVGLTALP
ncbi:MAG: DMT family transporter [Actinomycetota bacterium]|nr:DMT family transporter [Actinomycetota bacterium]